MASGFKACPFCRSRAERIVEQDARVAELEAFAEAVREAGYDAITDEQYSAIIRSALDRLDAAERERDVLAARLAAADRLLRSLDPEHSPCVVDDAIAALSDAPAMAVVEGWTYHDNKDPDDFWTREEWMNVTPTKERDSQIPVTVVVLHAKAKE